jgi:VanZ family protein
MKANFDRLLLGACVMAIFTIAILALVPGDLRPHTVTLVPRDMRPHTGMSQQIEHLTAYLSAALLIGLRLRNWRQLVQMALLLFGFAGILEIAQLWIPGRDAQFIDFVASAIGAVIGLAAGSFATSVYQRLLKDRIIG